MFRDRIKNKIPRIESVPIVTVLNRASNDSTLKPVDSELSGVGYIMSDDEIVIITHLNGYMRLPKKLAKLIFKEALECLEVMP